MGGGPQRADGASGGTAALAGAGIGTGTSIGRAPIASISSISSSGTSPYAVVPTSAGWSRSSSRTNGTTASAAIATVHETARQLYSSLR